MSHRIKFLCLLLVLSFVGFQYSNAEIHRAVKNKHPVRQRGSEQQQMSKSYSSETWLYSLISASVVGLSGIFPLLVIPLDAGKALRKGESAAFLNLLLSFSVGALLGDVFLHLLPEAWAHTKGHDHSAHTYIGLWIMAGILAFMIIEKVFPDDHNEEDEETETNLQKSTAVESVPKSPKKKSSPRQRKNKTTQNGHVKATPNGHTANGHVNGHINGNTNGVANGMTKKAVKSLSEKVEHIKTSGWLNLLANVIDNFTHGLAVASSYCVSTKVGFVTFIAILLHEIPHEVGDFAILLKAGFNRWKAAKAQILTASSSLFGAVTALMAESTQAAGDSTAWILPFTSGGFIYIALVTVVPDLLKESSPKESLKQIILVLSGILSMAAVTLLC